MDPSLDKIEISIEELELRARECDKRKTTKRFGKLLKNEDSTNEIIKLEELKNSKNLANIRAQELAKRKKMQ